MKDLSKLGLAALCVEYVNRRHEDYHDSSELIVRFYDNNKMGSIQYKEEMELDPKKWKTIVHFGDISEIKPRLIGEINKLPETTINGRKPRP